MDIQYFMDNHKIRVRSLQSGKIYKITGFDIEGNWVICRQDGKVRGCEVNFHPNQLELLNANEYTF